MNRKIKFRVRTKDGETLIIGEKTFSGDDWEGFYVLLNEEDLIYIGVDEDEDGNGYNYIELESIESIDQYTGLKDKNGKEIYEGDIVKCILGNKPIVFHDCRYWLGETLDDLFVANLRYDIEVIGNIHENPELLPRS